MRPAMPAAPHPRQAMVQNSRRWMETSDVIPMFPTFVWKVQLEAGLRERILIKVREGTLLMFPSYLEHSVDANTSDEERVSVSFNVMFSSFTEHLSKPLW